MVPQHIATARTSRHDGGFVHRVCAGRVQRHERMPALVVRRQPPILLIDHRALRQQTQISQNRVSAQTCLSSGLASLGSLDTSSVRSLNT